MREVLSTEVRRIGEDVAGPAADAVDRDARFPAEAVAELRRRGLLGALVPADHGGPGASVEELAGAVSALAEHCASSALVLAMHGIQVATIARHASPRAREDLLPRIARGELLLANANSEVGLGGERRSSLCALEARDGGFRLRKHASTVSYGEAADGVLATARRAPDSPPQDQVLAICLPPELTIVPTGGWNTLGLRGTCSRPCDIDAQVPADHVIADYPRVFPRTALPVSTVLLSAVWLGIAEGAARRAHATVRAAARKRAGQSPDGGPPPAAAVRLAELAVVLHQLREVLAGGAAAWERTKDTGEVETLRFATRMDNLKLSASTLAGDVVLRALGIAGLAGYSNDSPFSMGRLLRDVAAAPLMVNNDRALHATARSLLIRKDL